MKRTLCAVCLLAAAPLSHASAVRANKLPLPKTMTCLALKQPISYTMTTGMFHLGWEIELGRGAYVSELEDGRGTYYRAPPGAITQQRVNKKTHAGVGRVVGFVGGIYVPHDAAAAPRLYTYYGSYGAPEEHPKADADCSSLTYAIDPQTHRVNVWSTGVATGIGAGMGMALGRSFHPHVQGSYGQAAGVGLLGGLLGGLIIGAIEKSKAGEIIPGPQLSSDAIDKIKTLASGKVPIYEKGHAPDSGLATASPTPLTAPASMDETPAAAAPAVAPETATATDAALSSAAVHPDVAIAAVVPTHSDMASRAQRVADQMKCDAVQPSGTGFVASCGSYAVFIDCDSGSCRPTHTVKPGH